MSCPLNSYHLRMPAKISVKACRRLACAAMALLSACHASGPDDSFRNYLERLGRTLSVEVPARNNTLLPRLPRPAQLQLKIPGGSLDALDFLAVRGCALQVTIGKRNSSLGRMARPSQRLLLELEYLQLAPECIADQREQGRETLADTLQQAWNMKREHLPALIFNATLGSDEYRSLWHIPASAGNYPAQTSSAVIASLHAINKHAIRWLGGDYQADNRAFEILLSEVMAGDGGALLQALAQQAEWLEASNAMLRQRMAKGPLCTPTTRPAAADILPNVIRRYFVGETQPRTAALGRRYHELLPPLTALEELLAARLPANYRAWQEQRNAGLEQWIDAPRQHVAALIALQQPCLPR